MCWYVCGLRAGISNGVRGERGLFLKGKGPAYAKLNKYLITLKMGTDIDFILPFPIATSYAATKHAVVGLSRSLRYEGEALGIKVSAVCPAFIESNIYSGERVGVEFGLKESIPFRIIPVDEACAKILQGVANNKEIIIFPRYARVMWWLDRYFWAPLRRMHRKSVGVFRHRKRKAQRQKEEVRE